MKKLTEEQYLKKFKKLLTRDVSDRPYDVCLLKLRTTVANIKRLTPNLNIQRGMFRFLCLLPVIGGVFILLTKQLEWYDRNKKIYHIWFILSTAYLIVLLITYYIGTLGI